MKAIPSNITKALPVGAKMVCVDNSGAKVVQIISVRGFKGKRRTTPAAGVAGIVNVKVLRGEQKVRHEVHRAVIIRQTRPFRRPDGMRVSFEDNACVLVNDNLEPKGSLIKGPVPKEVVQRFQLIGKISRMVV
jgi:large subunit ribosomal protein L14